VTQKRRKGIDTSKTYYLSKDIRFLSHDKLIDKYRDLVSFAKKVNKTTMKKQKERSKNLEANKPILNFDNIIKQRYPTFQAALHDLDDCLSLSTMFSILKPSIEQISPEKLQRINRLLKEFHTYVVKTNTLSKVFLSIKGIYYQAVIYGVKVTWLSPYDFVQNVTDEIDFHVFDSFLVLYENLMKFINYKLYFDMGLKYPSTEELPTSLYFNENEKNEIKVLFKSEEKMVEKNEEEKKKEEKRLKTIEFDKIMIQEKQIKTDEIKEDVDEDVEEKKKLIFHGLTFFVSRECPRNPIEFVVTSFGGKCTFNEEVPTITHFITDRNEVKKDSKTPDREYVQPQWIFDCVNTSLLLPVDYYLVGKILPPHLSPFADYSKIDAYIPEYALELKKLQGNELPTEETTDLVDSDEELEKIETNYQKEIIKEFKGEKYSTHKEEQDKLEKIELETKIKSKAEFWNMNKKKKY